MAVRYYQGLYAMRELSMDKIDEAKIVIRLVPNYRNAVGIYEALENGPEDKFTVGEILAIPKGFMWRKTRLQLRIEGKACTPAANWEERHQIEYREN